MRLGKRNIGIFTVDIRGRRNYKPCLLSCRKSQDMHGAFAVHHQRLKCATITRNFQSCEVDYGVNALCDTPKRMLVPYVHIAKVELRMTHRILQICNATMAQVVEANDFATLGQH